jgi:glycosyltransferase involved in cell wall biosynthesis
MPRRRLLFVLYEVTFGGVERQAELLAEAAKAAGFDVSLMVLGTEGPALHRFRPQCDDIQILNAPLSKDWRLHRSVAQAAAGKTFTAAFLFSTAKFTVISHALKEAAPRQVLNVGNPVHGAERWKQTLRAWLFPPSPGLHLVANSRHTLRSLEQHPFYRRFPLHVSPNCVRMPTGPASIRPQTKPFRIGMVARLDPIKDHETLLRAVALLRDQGQTVTCELLGRGSLETELKRLASELRLTDSGVVRFLGWSDNVEEVLRSWDLFVFSTTALEGFGNAAAEAMAMGLPCIFTDVGPCREVGGDAVVYVPPQNPSAFATAIQELAQDPTRRQTLGGLAFDRARTHFQPARNLADFLMAIGEPL